MITDNNKYVIENYGKKSVFSNFLPGISGEMGTPLWCFYVNRGQGIASFGIGDKDHSIMQFYPAHQAYQNTKKLGFRTFLKANGTVVEAFGNENDPHTMSIGMNDLEIMEQNTNGKFLIRVSYITLPEEPVAGLVRKVTIENTGKDRRDFELIDGMPAILPYGISLSMMNEMGQTAKAWMQAEDHESGCPIFKLRASMEDSAEVREIKGGNYGFAIDEEGNFLFSIVSNEVLFGYDTSLTRPNCFMEMSMDELKGQKQKTQNDVPSCYFGSKFTLESGEKKTIYEVFGQTEDLGLLKELQKKVKTPSFFEDKFLLAEKLTWDITEKIHTKTNHRTFDLYCRQTYLDNVLRGGEPIVLGENKVFYLYSRKHGDMERDYNYFRLLPEYYSQGNGNFRDVNQNRRCDIRFSPYVGEENIKLFYKAIQIDGYNPLGIEKMTYFLEMSAIEESDNTFYQEIKEFLTVPFTPGELMKKLRESEREDAFSDLMNRAISMGKTDFIEGYWSDHWTYNLDLVEEYLSVFPEKEEELLFRDRSYTYLIGKECILPSRLRYQETGKGIRQYRFLEKNEAFEKDALLKEKNGNIVRHTLIEKMLLLGILKTAALDPRGMGVEMEGGKPGWYDALNGLPGLLGSSMAESYELERLLQFLLGECSKYGQTISVPKELDLLLSQLLVKGQSCFDQLDVLSKDEKGTLTIDREELLMRFYLQRQTALENYRESVKSQLSGEFHEYQMKDLIPVLELLLHMVRSGIERAMEEKEKNGNGICPTYFYYSVLDYKKTEQGIELVKVKQETVPDFLEGSVRYFKTDRTMDQKRELYHKIKQSPLFDTKLSMYKVNSGLDKASYEIGRAKAFTPGWLENESIWLHMEYKYLLELLKSDLYEEFLEDMEQALIPFQEESRYGRSLLENSSFIASSANPDESIHGKGFVARLSGSTVEWIHMWQIMMFGKKPFIYENGDLSLSFKPLIPNFLIGEDKKIEAMFLGTCKVTYVLPDQNTISEKNSIVESYQLIYKDGTKESVHKDTLDHPFAIHVREGKVKEIVVTIKRKEM